MALPDSPTQAAPKTSLISIERVVALLTPVFAGAAGWLFTVITKSIPGVNLPHDQFVAVFVSGAVLATSAALAWLFGRQKWTHVTQVTSTLTTEARKVMQEAAPEIPQLREIEAALEAHEAAIVTAVTNRVGAPAAASDVAREIVGQLWPSHQPAGVAVVDSTVAVPPLTPPA